jgi:hypothetical protein
MRPHARDDRPERRERQYALGRPDRSEPDEGACRAVNYIFEHGFSEVHLVGANAPPPERGTVTDSFRLRCVFFDESNNWVRTRLLEELGLSDTRLDEMDLADQERFNRETCS